MSLVVQWLGFWASKVGVQVWSLVKQKEKGVGEDKMVR